MSAMAQDRIRKEAVQARNEAEKLMKGDGFDPGTAGAPHQKSNPTSVKKYRGIPG